MEFLLAWLRQPSSVAGISALIGTLSGVIAGQMSWGQAIPLLSGAIVAILVPDNSAARADAQAAGAEIVTAISNQVGGAS